MKRGAARTVNLELSPAYDEEAVRLLREAGVERRRRLHDIAADPSGIDAADVVVLHRVVCCYPDYERLLGAAAEHARRLLVFSYPPRNVASRLLIGAQNLFFRLRRMEFRTFVHAPARMLAAVEERGSPGLRASAADLADSRIRALVAEASLAAARRQQKHGPRRAYLDH